MPNVRPKAEPEAIESLDADIRAKGVEIRALEGRREGEEPMGR